MPEDKKTYEKHTGFRRLKSAFFNSLNGYKFAFKSDEAVRIEFIVIALLMPVAIFSGKLPVEILLLISGLFAVLITELLNTAIECAIDRISEAYHELSKASKDIASGAVLLSIIYCVIIWGVIFLP